MYWGDRRTKDLELLLPKEARQEMMDPKHLAGID